MVESLQWGLQGHVSSVSRKGGTLVGATSGRSQRISRDLWDHGRGWEGVSSDMTRQLPMLSKRDGSCMAKGSSQCGFFACEVSGEQGTQMPPCPC